MASLKTCLQRFQCRVKQSFKNVFDAMVLDGMVFPICHALKLLATSISFSINTTDRFNLKIPEYS